MRYVKWTLLLLVALILFAFFDYTLPRHTVVRVVSVDTQRMDLGTNAWFFASADSGGTQSNSRDIKFIQTILPNGKPLVFRNEDTGWGWPPYFKFNSFNLQTEASNYVSNASAPKWVMVTHYGWRIQFLTVFQNAVRLTPVAGPDVTWFPWASVLVLLVLVLVLVALWRMWRHFRERSIEPILGEMGDAWDRADAEADNRRRRFGGFWRRLVGRFR